ncbi:MAG: hypothetical protein PHY09_16805 [Desulfuromonadaceae bacterium]|nr:hypothetical protein [Desulfuromonadaceae bacterium]MDD5107575.1 hypothetical protein [Desulfuromonadaceae bacterium]
MPTQTSRTYARLCRKTIPLVCLLASLISTTGCQRRYVVIPPGETIQANKTQIDQLYRDNEQLLEALGKCRSGR